MHKEILSEKQLELLPLIKQFNPEFYLAGGTAIALHIGHRRSIDFDLFKSTGLKHRQIIDKISPFDFHYTIARRVDEQLDIIINHVKLTFMEYPFAVLADCNFDDYAQLPDLLTLAALKAYALGRRSKWKDYVDMYFIIKDYYTVGQISKQATQIFDPLFSEKMFRSQLCYFDDIDYSETIDFIGDPVPAATIKSFLTDQATGILN